MARTGCPPGEIVIRRAYTFNETQALARDLEEQRLQRDMQTDAIAADRAAAAGGEEAGLNGIRPLAMNHAGSR